MSKDKRNVLTLYLSIKQAKEILNTLTLALDEAEKDKEKSSVYLANPDIWEPNVQLEIDPFI